LETPGGSDAKIWGNAIYTEYARLDRWPANPNGLSYGTPTYLRTGVSMLTFSELMLKHIPDVTFPFLIIHDKEDKITKYSGSAEAVRLAKSKDKRLIDIPRGLHDPFSNDLHGMLASIIPWLNNH
jgi:alpha-beta hydrolase superfamily lysophospholipase